MCSTSNFASVFYTYAFFEQSDVCAICYVMHLPWVYYQLSYSSWYEGKGMSIEKYHEGSGIWKHFALGIGNGFRIRAFDVWAEHLMYELKGKNRGALFEDGFAGWEAFENNELARAFGPALGSSSSGLDGGTRYFLDNPLARNLALYFSKVGHFIINDFSYNSYRTAYRKTPL